jgi:hypothetical protein
MERAPSLGVGVFRSADELLCELAGRYWTDVRITTTDANGHRLDVFRDRWSGFSVAPASQADCRARAAATKTRTSRDRAASLKWIVNVLVIAAIFIAAWVWRKTKS